MHNTRNKLTTLLWRTGSEQAAEGVVVWVLRLFVAQLFLAAACRVLRAMNELDVFFVCGFVCHVPQMRQRRTFFLFLINCHATGRNQFSVDVNSKY